MRRPALPVIATSAVVGALAIAVPALASPAARTAARHCSAVIVISHHHRVRACLLQGPRGYKGFNGANGKTGPAGKNGVNGKEGKEGKAGTNGTVVAYAVVQPTSTPPTVNLITASGITSVSEPNPGVYCITPTAGVSLAAGLAAVSPEVSYGTPAGTPGIIAVNAQHTNCPSAPYEVDTYAPGTTPTLATGYAFTIVIP